MGFTTVQDFEITELGSPMGIGGGIFENNLYRLVIGCQ